MTGTGAAYARPAESGHAVLAAVLNLQPTASGTWSNTTLEVVLPSAGTWNLDAVVRGNLSGVSPVNAWISARLFDVTTGAVVPNTESMVYQVGVTASAPTSITDGGNQGGGIATRYTTTGPRTIRLQAQRTNSVGASTVAAIHSDGFGRTTLRYARVA